MAIRTGKYQREKIFSMVIILKAKFNSLVKEGKFNEAIGLQMAIEMLEEYFANEIKLYKEKEQE